MKEEYRNVATETQVQIVREDPEIEAYRKGLLRDVQQFVRDRIAGGQVPPDFQVAQLSDAERQAIERARAGIGGFQPFIDTARQGITDATQQVSGGFGRFTPTSEGIATFMNPFEQAVIDKTLADLSRASGIEANKDAARAVAAGAFGGTREAVQAAERGRNLLEQQAKVAAQLRASGFTTASEQARQAFENERTRQLQGAELLGNLGTRQAALGELQSRLGAQDVQTLGAVGQLERGINQATLDALRQTNLQRFQQPYQQYAFLSDIYKGVPSGQSTSTMATSPQVSPLQQIAGLGIAGLSAFGGAKAAGLF